MASLCLNMIVRNEADKIERCLKSVVDHIEAYAILDTGSADDTIDRIKSFFSLTNIKGVISQGKFENFEQARNDALGLAHAVPTNFTDILLMDADMELVVTDPDWRAQIIGSSYDMVQQGGGLVYNNRRILNRDMPAKYRGVTHEYLDAGPAAGLIKGAYFIDHADGTNRKDKFVRDIKLLLAGLKKEPDNARYWYYLAQSWKDAGKPKQAAAAYKKRIELGGWDEEVWSANFNLAGCLKDMGDEDGYIRELFNAYNRRPSRAEPVYEAAKFFREKGNNATAVALAEAGMQIPLSTDALFVSPYPYITGCREEFAICAYYLPHKKEKGFKVADAIALDPRTPPVSRACASRNLYFYMEGLSNLVPSFSPKEIGFTPPFGYVPMNPSIARFKNSLYCIVRTVNYTITEEGRYAIRATDDSVNDSNPISTRNFLVHLNRSLNIQESVEIKRPDLPDPQYKLVVGFEDMRLIPRLGRLFASSTVREQNPEGYCEQWLSEIDRDGISYATHMKRPTRQTEKNWMPVLSDDTRILYFMHRINELIDENGNTVHVDTNVPYQPDVISGGSQIIPFRTGYLGVVHQAGGIPGQEYKRYYSHRFAWWDHDLHIRKISQPFYLHDKQIEFVAGLAWHPDKKHLLISYGLRDRSAWIATLDASEVAQVVIP